MSDTWKLVPVEPTEQMIEAGRHVKRMRLLDSVKAIREGRDPEELMGKTAGAEYRAMLEAAPAPPVPATVQEILRLIQPYVAACLKFNYTPMELIEQAEADVNEAFKPLEAALTALVEKNHELQFSLDGVNAMRRPLTDLETRKPWFTAQNEDDFSNEHRIWLSGFRRAEASHGIEPEQGESHDHS